MDASIDHGDLSQDVDYEKDYYAWVMRQVQLMRSGQVDALDCVNVAKEVATLIQYAQRSVKTALVIVMWHLLKYHYQLDQPERRSRRWKLTMLIYREQLHQDFKDSPSLVEYGQMIFDEAYQEARHYVAVDTGLPVETFSERRPFDWSQVLDEDLYEY